MELAARRISRRRSVQAESADFGGAGARHSGGSRATHPVAAHRRAHHQYASRQRQRRKANSLSLRGSWRSRAPSAPRNPVNPLVSVVIVNFNSGSALKSTLAAIPEGLTRRGMGRRRRRQCVDRWQRARGGGNRQNSPRQVRSQYRFRSRNERRNWLLIR